jgi:NAD(P)-dependent dehydrogenase (short-subunit alcohol dehydrogenase family)
MDLTETTAVVTGGGTGIGAATALALVAEGTRNVLVTYSRSADEAEQTVARLRESGADAAAVRVDVRVDAEVRSLATECESRFGGCDVLVNNAGTTSWVPHPDLDGLDDGSFQDILDVNVVGAFRCARALAPMLLSSGGAVVNLGSISAYRGIGSSIAYSVSKAAVLQLTRALAVALAPEVRVTSVSPGTVDTRWQRGHHGERGFADLAEAESRAAPLGRVTEADDVADAVVGLLRADMVTGVDVVVDGGKHLGY